MSDSYHLLYFLYGASIMFHLMMAWIFCYGRRTRFRVFVSVLMLLTVAQYVKDLIFLGEKYYDSSCEERFVSSVDVLSVPMYAVVLVEACRPLWVTWRRAVAMYAPLVAALLVFLFNPQEKTHYTYYALHIVTVVYCLGFVVWVMRELPLFEHSLKEEYSYDDGINFYWMRGITLLFFSMLLLWMYGSLNPGAYTDIVFLVGSLFVWVLACFFFYRQSRVLGVVMSNGDSSLFARPFTVRALTPKTAGEALAEIPPAALPETVEAVEEDVAAEAEVPPVDDPQSEAAFAERMHLLFEKEHVYLNPRLRLSELAALLGTNRTYLSQYFNQNCGSTFYDFVNDYRIHYAKMLLHSTDYTLDVIAEKSGFNSLSTFRRAFRQREGCSAIEFRAAQK